MSPGEACHRSRQRDFHRLDGVALQHLHHFQLEAAASLNAHYRIDESNLVSYGSNSELGADLSKVRSSPNNRHVTTASACLKSANTGSHKPLFGHLIGAALARVHAVSARNHATASTVPIAACSATTGQNSVGLTKSPIVPK